MLKEGFPDVVQHIDQLEKQGKVLVTRHAKDNAPKYVFWNEITVEQGGMMVDAGAAQDAIVVSLGQILTNLFFP